MSPVASSPSTPALELGGPTAVLGPYAQRLRDDILVFVVSTLPQTLQAFPAYSHHPAKPPATGNESGYETLLRIYSTLPFHVFKHAVESPSFPVGIGAYSYSISNRSMVVPISINIHLSGGEQTRFRFAKEAIAARKKSKVGRDAEESVVLAFGKAEGGSAVHVTRKMKKRPLWKVAK